MKKGKSDLEHQGDIILNMSNRLARRFFKYENENQKEDLNYLTDLSKSIGYLTVVNTNVNRTVKQENRLSALEEKLKNTPINMTMFEETPLEEYR